MQKVRVTVWLLLVALLLPILAYTLYPAYRAPEYTGNQDSQTTAEPVTSVVEYAEPDYGDWDPLGYSTAKVALDLARLLYAEDNMAISPLSIVSALAPVYECSRGAAKRELASFLGLPLEPGKVRDSYRGFTEMLLNPTGTGYKLSLANGIWVRSDLKPDAECSRVSMQYYNVGVYEADFARDPEASRVMINEWVAERTNNLIKEIIPIRGITPETTAVVVNALYFKSAWMEPFKPVKNLRFNTPHGVVNVTGMSNIDEYRYYEDSLIKAVLIPYKAPGYHMLVILPVNGDIAGLLDDLDHDYISRIIDGSKELMVDLTMPQFRVESSYKLKNAMARLGMNAIFTPGAEVYIVEGGTGSLNQVYHKVYINVDWRGTEAAASTAGVFRESLPVVDVKLVVDRPFMYMIIHEDTRIVLFYGIVVDPSQSS